MSQKRTSSELKLLFAFLIFQAVHIPVQAPKEYIEKYKDTYSEGW